MNRSWILLLLCTGLLLGPLGFADIYHLEGHACKGDTPMHECPICSAARAGALIVSSEAPMAPAAILVETLFVTPPTTHSTSHFARACDRGPPSLT